MLLGRACFGHWFLVKVHYSSSRENSRVDLNLCNGQGFFVIELKYVAFFQAVSERLLFLLLLCHQRNTSILRCTANSKIFFSLLLNLSLYLILCFNRQ